MAKLVIVQVPAKDGIPAHTEQMRPEEAARFWEAQERQFRERQVQIAERREVSQQMPPGSGAMLTGESPSMRAALQSMGLEVQDGTERTPPFERTLMWSPEAPLRLDLVPHGLRFLDRWQVCAPVWSYTELARDIGGDAERETTQAVIRDLRVLAFDTRVLFLRKCKDTEDLLALWRAEQEAVGGDLRLSFLRALYIEKPLFWPLPTTWLNGKQ